MRPSCPLNSSHDFNSWHPQQCVSKSDESWKLILWLADWGRFFPCRCCSVWAAGWPAFLAVSFRVERFRGLLVIKFHACGVHDHWWGLQRCLIAWIALINLWIIVLWVDRYSWWLLLCLNGLRWIAWGRLWGCRCRPGRSFWQNRLCTRRVFYRIGSGDLMSRVLERRCRGFKGSWSWGRIRTKTARGQSVVILLRSWLSHRTVRWGCCRSCCSFLVCILFCERVEIRSRLVDLTVF